MIKHIVMFKLNNEFSGNEKMIMCEEIKSLLSSLPEKIKEILLYEIGINYSESAVAYDMVLVSGFKDKESLAEYSKNAEHLKVLDFINKACSEKKVVDYII